MRKRLIKILQYISLVIVVAITLWFALQPALKNNSGFDGKTTWDWLELLIIPITLALGAFYLEHSEQEIERELAHNRFQEVALQTYFDQMSELILKSKLRTTRNKEILSIARIRTLTILRQMWGRRIGYILLFLQEAGLINKDKPIINLRKANMNGNALIGGIDLSGVCLRGVQLVGADMWGVDLEGADLRGALLKGANLELACLKDADLFMADLTGENLKDANLSNVDLRKVRGITKKQLAKVRWLKGATMPDGTIHD